MQPIVEGVALITGGGSGIGASLATALAARGAAVVVADINLDSAAKVAEQIKASGGQATAAQVDVTSEAGWGALVEQVERDVGPIGMLCSNAGVVGAMKPLLELSPDYFRWVMDVNLMGSVLGVQAVGPRMVARGKGRIIITSSMGGVSVARLLSDYCASKHSLIAIAESLRQELAGTGVEVSVLCPAAVQTGLTQNTQRDLPERLAGTVGLGGAAAESAVAASKSASGGAMSPDDVATLTLAALGRGDFYIFTHPSAEERVVARSNEMSTAFARLKAG